MYHAWTPQRIKHQVLRDAVNNESQIRFVIATSALGTGINIPNIQSNALWYSRKY